MKYLIAALVAALMAVPASADVTVGTETGANCYPFVCNDTGGIDYYQVYSSSAFSGPLNFSTITFQNATGYPPASMLSGNYTISFGLTSSGIGSNPAGTLTNVASFYTGSLAPAQFTIAGAAYNYDPSLGNLVMHVIASGQPLVTNGSGNSYLAADYIGSATSRSYLLNNGDSYSGTGALVTTFGGAVPEPAMWGLMILGFGIVGGAMRRRNVAIALAA